MIIDWERYRFKTVYLTSDIFTYSYARSIISGGEPASIGSGIGIYFWIESNTPKRTIEDAE